MLRSVGTVGRRSFLRTATRRFIEICWLSRRARPESRCGHTVSCPTMFTSFSLRRERMWESRQLAGGVIEQLPREEWKYFVIAFQGGNQNMVDLEYAFVLCPWEITVGFTVIQRSAYHAGRLYEMLDPNAYTIPEMMEITQSQSEEVASIFRRIQECGHKSLDVRENRISNSRFGRTAHQVQYKVPRLLRNLGVSPCSRAQGTDPYESITRQVKQKLALLDNRWDPRMDFSIFGEVSAETIWGKMYDYRSSSPMGMSRIQQKP